MKLLTLLPAVLAIAASLVSASPVELTNAERIKRGLPLKVPARMYNASATHNLRARASLTPEVPVDQPTRIISVSGQSGPGKRQATRYLYVDGTTVKVGSDPATAVNVVTPSDSPTRQRLTALSADRANLYLCASYDQSASPRIAKIITQTFTPPTPATDANEPSRQCFLWRISGSTLTAVLADNTTPWVLATGTNGDNTLYAYTGGTDDQLPPVSQRLGLGLVTPQQNVDPAVYNARIAVEGTPGTTGLRYLQYKENADSSAGFYPVTIDGATIFQVIPSPNASGRSRLGFTYNNVLRFAGLKVLGQMYCLVPDDPTTCPNAHGEIQASGGPYSSIPTPLQIDAWSLPNSLPGSGIDGISARFYYSDTFQGQPASFDREVAFSVFYGSNNGNKAFVYDASLKTRQADYTSNPLRIERV